MSNKPKWLLEVVDAAEEVLKNLGDIQYIEGVYEEALCHELRLRGIPYERQRKFELMYKGYTVGTAICDFILNPHWAAKKGNEHVLELKAVKKINKSHVRQAQVYMMSLNIKSGAVLSFYNEVGIIVEPLEMPDVKPVDLKVKKPAKKKTTKMAEQKLINLIKKAVKEVHTYFGTEFIYREKTNRETYRKAIGVELRLKGIETSNATYPILYKCQQVHTFEIPFIFADNSAMAFEFYKKPEDVEENKEYYDYYAKQFNISRLYLALIPQTDGLELGFVIL